MSSTFYYIGAGIQISIYSMGLFLLFSEANHPRAAKRAVSICALMMVYFLFLTIAPFGYKYIPEQYMNSVWSIDTMCNLIVANFVVILLTELTRIKAVTPFLILEHLIVPLSFIGCCTLAMFIEPDFCRTLMWIDVVITTIYCLYNMRNGVKATRKYKKEISEIYADDEGHSIDWFWPVQILVIADMILYFLLTILIQSEITKNIFNIIVVIPWILLPYYISKMRCTDDIPIFSDDTNHIMLTASQVADISNEKSQEETDIEQKMIMDKLGAFLENKSVLASEHLNRNDIAQKIETNSEALTKAIHTTTGMTFAEYVADLRLLYASQLLISTSESIDNIVANCGFRSKPTFYKGFTLKFNCTPSEYRSRFK